MRDLSEPLGAGRAVAPGTGVHFGFGVGFVGADDQNDAEVVLRLARIADQDGLDLFSVADHPYTARRLDAYATLGFVLAQTRNLTGLVNVTNLPTRPAPMLARTVTSLSALSGGRVVLGLGAGGDWDEIVRMGMARRSPASAVDALAEAIEMTRKLSGGGPAVTINGAHYQVHELDPAPVPACPVWTGSMGPKSLAVTGRLADGWIPAWASDWLSDRYRRSRPLIDEAAAAAGRSPDEVATIYVMPGQITAAPVSAVRDETGRWVGGSVQQWVDELTSAVLDHGASGFIFFATGTEPAEIELARWAREVVPAVREAITKAR
ncbi:LLM class flavin-dependent oxidoreductase [Amycolatopsis anabasis]|uniref:LLM class flavin-dependent oxidoreductase n=1 Tax=Amycolatopsis anabasis TaxID=1840409 RepID=UPI00131E0555|nr:LLM class flavin-dependent oxidoreductase [Amycolatopsis anabasis]